MRLQTTKAKIQHQFNKAALSYDSHCNMQNTICQQAIELLIRHRVHFNNIADIACGTGESTQQLITQLQFKHCTAIDFAEKLLLQAQQKLKHYQVDFLLSDLDEKIFNAPHFDLLFCNMGLQWSMNLSKAIQHFNQYLNPKGLLLFTMPINGNFPEINASFKLPLPEHTEIETLLINSNFEILECHLINYASSYEHQIALLKSLKLVGANHNKSKTPIHITRNTLHQIFTESDNTSLTYKIGIYLARRAQ